MLKQNRFYRLVPEEVFEDLLIRSLGSFVKFKLDKGNRMIYNRIIFVKSRKAELLNTKRKTFSVSFLFIKLIT